LRADGLRVVRNVGRAGWTDVTDTALPGLSVPKGAPGPVAFAAGDLDGDGKLETREEFGSG